MHDMTYGRAVELLAWHTRTSIPSSRPRIKTGDWLDNIPLCDFIWYSMGLRRVSAKHYQWHPTDSRVSLCDSTIANFAPLVHQKTVNKLIRNGMLVYQNDQNDLLVWSGKRLAHHDRKYYSNHRRNRPSKGSNKPSRLTPGQKWYQSRTNCRMSALRRTEAKNLYVAYNDVINECRHKQAEEALHADTLLQNKLKRRAKIETKKQNRKYNRAVIKNRDAQGKDYIWW